MRYKSRTVPAPMGDMRGRVSVRPGGGNGKLGSGSSWMLVKNVAALFSNPDGVGTESGLVRTSIATVVELLTSPGGKIMDAREPKTMSSTVAPDEVTVPSGVRLGL